MLSLMNRAAKARGQAKAAYWRAQWTEGDYKLRGRRPWAIRTELKFFHRVALLGLDR